MIVPKIRLLEDRVLIKPLEEERKLPSGLVLPKNVWASKELKGIVVAVGDYLEERLLPGQLVYYREDAGVMMDLEEGSFLVTRETNILLVRDENLLDPFKAIELLQELNDHFEGLPLEKLTPFIQKVRAYFDPVK